MKVKLFILFCPLFFHGSGKRRKRKKEKRRKTRTTTQLWPDREKKKEAVWTILHVLNSPICVEIQERRKKKKRENSRGKFTCTTCDDLVRFRVKVVFFFTPPGEIFLFAIPFVADSFTSKDQECHSDGSKETGKKLTGTDHRHRSKVVNLRGTDDFGRLRQPPSKETERPMR